jgi:hypothetical protein
MKYRAGGNSNNVNKDGPFYSNKLKHFVTNSRG